MAKSKNKGVRLRFRFFLLLFGLVCTVAGVWYFVGEKKIFQVRQIGVEGLTSYTEEFLLEQLQVGLGSNILNFRTEAFKHRLHDMPRIRSVTVKHKYPDQVVLVVEERQGEFLLDLGGNFYLIDSDGIIFSEPQLSDEYNLPCIVNSETLEFSLGQPLPDGSGRLLFQLLSKFPPELRENISEVAFYDGSVVLYTVDGVKVLWGGDADNLTSKIEVWERLPEIAADYGSIEYIDLRFGDNPVIKMRESGE